MKAGEVFENPMETPFIPTWNRVVVHYLQLYQILKRP